MVRYLEHLSKARLWRWEETLPRVSRRRFPLPLPPLPASAIINLSRSSKDPHISTMDASMARMFQQMIGGAMADVGIGGSDLSQVIIILFLCISYAQISVSCSRTMMLTIFYLFVLTVCRRGLVTSSYRGYIQGR